MNILCPQEKTDAKKNNLAPFVHFPYIATFYPGFISGFISIFLFSTLLIWLYECQATPYTSLGTVVASSIYALKVLMAPWLECRLFYPGEKFFGRWSFWIICGHLGLTLSFYFLAKIHPAYHALGTVLICTFISTMGCIQDMVWEVWRTSFFSPQDQNRACAINASGYRVGGLTSTGLLLLGAHLWGWSHLFFMTHLFFLWATVGIALLSSFFKHHRGKELWDGGQFSPPPKSPSLFFTRYFQHMRQEIYKLHQHIPLGWLFLFFILCRLSDISVRNLLPMVLLKLGHSKKNLAIFDKGFGVIAVFIGISLASWVVKTAQKNKENTHQKTPGLIKGFLLWQIGQVLTSFFLMISETPIYSLTSFPWSLWCGLSMLNILSGFYTTLIMIYMAHIASFSSPALPIVLGFMGSLGSFARMFATSFSIYAFSFLDSLGSSPYFWKAFMGMSIATSLPLIVIFLLKKEGRFFPSYSKDTCEKGADLLKRPPPFAHQEEDGV